MDSSISSVKEDKDRLKVILRLELPEDGSLAYPIAEIEQSLLGHEFFSFENVPQRVVEVLSAQRDIAVVVIQEAGGDAVASILQSVFHLLSDIKLQPRLTSLSGALTTQAVKTSHHNEIAQLLSALKSGSPIATISASSDSTLTCVDASMTDGRSLRKFLQQVACKQPRGISPLSLNIQNAILQDFEVLVICCVSLARSQEPEQIRELLEFAKSLDTKSAMNRSVPSSALKPKSNSTVIKTSKKTLTKFSVQQQISSNPKLQASMLTDKTPSKVHPSRRFPGRTAAASNIMTGFVIIFLQNTKIHTHLFV